MPPLPLADRPLTALQLSTLDFIRARHRATGEWPTVAQIAEEFRVSRKTTRDRLVAMALKGILTQEREGLPFSIVDREGAQSA